MQTLKGESVPTVRLAKDLQVNAEEGEQKETDMTGVSHGNAGEAATRHGWFVGYFVANDPYRQTTAVEMKWWVHQPGNQDKPFGGNRCARSMSILIQGAFRFEFLCGDHREEVLLKNPGDYAVWLPGIEHRGLAQQEDTIMLTMRWPSVPRDHYPEK